MTARTILSKLKRPSKRAIFIAVIVIAVLAFIFFPRGDANAKVETTTVNRQDLRTEVASSGTLTGKNTVDLKFQSGGKLAYLNFKEGESVQKGDLIAGLDAQALNIALQQAENNYKARQATVEKIYDDSKHGDQGESFEERDIRTQAEVARDNAFDSVKAARRAFQDATIYAPIDGIITQSKLTPGQNVSPADLVSQIVNFSEIIFSAEIDEADISKVSLGQKVELSLDAYSNDKFTGQVIEILPITKQTTTGSTVVVTKISIDKSKVQTIAGLNGQATIITSEIPNVLVIPVEALTEDNFVYVKEGETYKKTAVTPGVSTDIYVEIKEGLSEGQTIATNPQDVKEPSTNFFSSIFQR